MPALKVKAAGAWQTIIGSQGPQGIQGIQGPAGPSGFPVGMPAPWLLATAPTGFLLADGSQFDGTVYPALAALYGSTFGAVSGNLYRLPNLTGKFLVGRDTTPGGTAGVDRITTLGDTGGAKRVQLSSAESGMPSHGHNYSGTTAAETQEHQHYVSVGGGGHEHTYVSNVNRQNYTSGGSFGGTYAETPAVTGGGGGHTHEAWSGGRSATHNHTFSGSTDAGPGAVGASSSHLNMPPYYTCNWIIRAAP